MNDIEFKDYAPLRGGSSSSPYISIGSKGSFGFSKGFVDKFLNEKYNYVLLKYGERSSATFVGFVFSQEKKGGSLKLYKPLAGNASVSAIGFFKQFNLDASKINKRYSDFEQLTQRDEVIFIIQLPK